MEKLLERTLQSHLGQSTPLNLADSIRYSLLAPGKRIRPRLMLACAEMLGVSTKAITPAALALEMIHCFTLIHDDLPCMDDDDFRRGLPSNHKKFGEGLALLAGDGLLALAMEVFLDSALEGSVKTEAVHQGLKRLLRAVGPQGVIGGQAAESLLHSKSTLKDVQHMHSLKTGALFEAAILVPKDFACISDTEDRGRALISFAHELGLAFQVADDLEDELEDDLKGNEVTPTSVLYYLSRVEAAERTATSLNQIQKALTQHWGAQAFHLNAFADEILRKIESAT